MDKEAIGWNAIIWNMTIVLLSVLILFFGVLVYCTPEMFRGVIQKQGIQIIVITFTMPVILFLLATDKIAKEAGLSLLGAIVGYAFGAAWPAQRRPESGIASDRLRRLHRRRLSTVQAAGSRYRVLNSRAVSDPCCSILSAFSSSRFASASTPPVIAVTSSTWEATPSGQ
jgi:hypothetical protein